MSDEEVTSFGHCPRCGQELRFQVSLFVDASAGFFHGLSKEALRSSAVQILGAGWPEISWYCPKGDWAQPWTRGRAPVRKDR